MSRHGQVLTNVVGGNARRLHWLDALRAVASLIVMLGHYFWQLINIPFQDFLDPGGFGVAIFFFVSGYVIPLSIRPDRDAPALRFGWSRLFRLYPLYWLSLLLAALVYQTNLSAILVNATMIQRFIGAQDVIGVYWTLQIELLFYGIVTLTILARRFNQFSLIATLAIAFAAVAVLFGYVRYHYQLKFPLAVPIGLAVIFTGNIRSMIENGQATRRMFSMVAICVASLLVVSFFLGYRRSWGYDENPERFVVTYAAATLVFFGFYSLRKWHFPILSAIGAISYPIYLIHLPVHELAVRWLPGVDQTVVSLLAVAVVIVLSWVLHVTVEKPFVRLGRTLLPLDRRLTWSRVQPLVPTHSGER